MMGVFLSLVQLIVLIDSCRNKANWIEMAVSRITWGMSQLFMYGNSCLYHATFQSSDKTRMFWSKMDQAGIFFIISGTIFPIFYEGIKDELGF